MYIYKYPAYIRRDIHIFSFLFVQWNMNHVGNAQHNTYLYCYCHSNVVKKYNKAFFINLTTTCLLYMKVKQQSIYYVDNKCVIGIIVCVFTSNQNCLFEKFYQQVNQKIGFWFGPFSRTFSYTIYVDCQTDIHQIGRSCSAWFGYIKQICSVV